jgi:hypothetical protein
MKKPLVALSLAFAVLSASVAYGFREKVIADRLHEVSIPGPLTISGDMSVSGTITGTVSGNAATASAVAAAGVQAGDLGTGVKVYDDSIDSVSGSKVSGNITGNAANISGNLAAAQVASGDLGTGVKVYDDSIDSVSGSKVSGNITGNAANISGNLATAQIASGDLGTGVKVYDDSIDGVSGSKVSGNITGNAANISGNLPALQQLDPPMCADGNLALSTGTSYGCDADISWSIGSSPKMLSLSGKIGATALELGSGAANQVKWTANDYITPRAAGGMHFASGAGFYLFTTGPASPTLYGGVDGAMAINIGNTLAMQGDSYITSGSSITTTGGFFGDGSGLTGTATNLMAGAVAAADIQAGDLGTGVKVYDDSIDGVAGSKVSNLPAANIASGDLGTGVKVYDDSIDGVSGSKVSGNISGQAGSVASVAAAAIQTGTVGTGVLTSGLNAKLVSELQVLIPAVGGQMYFCSNCIPAKVVVSTGPAAGNFADIMGGEFK